MLGRTVKAHAHSCSSCGCPQPMSRLSHADSLVPHVTQQASSLKLSIFNVIFVLSSLNVFQACGKGKMGLAPRNGLAFRLLQVPLYFNWMSKKCLKKKKKIIESCISDLLAWVNDRLTLIQCLSKDHWWYAGSLLWYMKEILILIFKLYEVKIRLHFFLKIKYLLSTY